MTSKQFPTAKRRGVHKRAWSLSPEEDVVAAILDEADDIDDTLPADLWFRGAATALKCRADSHKVLPGLDP